MNTTINPLDITLFPGQVQGEIKHVFLKKLVLYRNSHPYKECKILIFDLNKPHVLGHHGQIIHKKQA